MSDKFRFVSNSSVTEVNCDRQHRRAGANLDRMMSMCRFLVLISSRLSFSSSSSRQSCVVFFFPFVFFSEEDEDDDVDEDVDCSSSSSCSSSVL